MLIIYAYTRPYTLYVAVWTAVGSGQSQDSYRRIRRGLQK
jgi:hypothetical protein